MKKLLFAFKILLLVNSVGLAQDKSPSKNISLGLNIGQIQKDFGIGLNLTSPYFANEKMAIRLRGNRMWNEHPNTAGDATWTSYSNLSFGMLMISGEIQNFVRLYGEGGVILLFPSSDFSSESSNIGGYGLFGFEFFFHEKYNYYLEIGGVGSGAKADNIPGKPIYSNGLLINAGFRWHF